MRHRLAPLALLITALSCGDNFHLDGSALLVSPQLGLYTDEAGATTTFTIALTSAPAADTIITIASEDTGEGIVAPQRLIFSPTNYARAQTVTVTGVDDRRADGDRAFVVLIGNDDLGTVELTVTNGDDDVASVAVAPVVGLTTSEAGGQASFSVQLTSQPSSDVIVPLVSSDLTEGAAHATSLVFTPDAFGPQTVTVTGVPDDAVDGNVTYQIHVGAATSGDPQYNGATADSVTLVNVDTSGPGIAVTPTSGLSVHESGTTATFSVVLQTPPAGSVAIPVTSSDASEASVSTASLVFTPANWNVAQTVTVTGVDDALDDGDQPWTIVLGAAFSADAAYDSLNPSDVTGTTLDNDPVSAAGITVMPTSGLQTTESGSTAVFTVKLDTMPSGLVNIGVSSSDTTEGTVSTASLQFTTVNWNTPQQVIVTGVDDALVDGTIAYTVVLAAATSTDAAYAGINPPDVSVQNLDNEVAGFNLDQTTLVVSEFRDADAFFISLTTQPTANVVLTITSSDTTEGTVSPATLTFTPQNWDTPQQVTVTGVDDNVSDGNIVFSLVTGAASSSDASYNGLNPPDLSVTNLDNDTAQVYVKARNNMFVSESGTSTTYRIRLTVTPTANVTCSLFSADTTEGTVSPMTLVFTPQSFGYQTITVTGVDDNVVDGDDTFQIVHTACTSTDPAYQGSNPRDVFVVNRDND